MAEKATALCFLSVSSLPRTSYCSFENSSSCSSLPFPPLLHHICSSSSSSPRPRPRPQPQPSRTLRLLSRASSSANSFGGSGGDDDLYGLYPWEPSNSESPIQWVPEDRVTLFTDDGLIQIGGSLVPRRVTSSERKQARSKASQRYQRFQEKDYMDPSQSLCLGALFDIAATNGHDMSRRLCIIGFCRSIEMLSDVVEDTVLEHGGRLLLLRRLAMMGYMRS
ncbi:hypothetical protein Dimus_034657 [Dionaea muscipula]